MSTCLRGEVFTGNADIYCPPTTDCHTFTRFKLTSTLFTGTASTLARIKPIPFRDLRPHPAENRHPPPLKLRRIDSLPRQIRRKMLRLYTAKEEGILRDRKPSSNNSIIAGIPPKNYVPNYINYSISSIKDMDMSRKSSFKA